MGNAANIIMLFLVVSGGFEMAVDVMVSRLLGAGKNKEKVAMARDTLFLSAISGLVLVEYHFNNEKANIRDYPDKSSFHLDKSTITN